MQGRIKSLDKYQAKSRQSWGRFGREFRDELERFAIGNQIQREITSQISEMERRQGRQYVASKFLDQITKEQSVPDPPPLQPDPPPLQSIWKEEQLLKIRVEMQDQISHLRERLRLILNKSQVYVPKRNRYVTKYTP
jgi:hypothetical protein